MIKIQRFQNIEKFSLKNKICRKTEKGEIFAHARWKSGVLFHEEKRMCLSDGGMDARYRFDLLTKTISCVIYNDIVYFMRTQ